MKKILIFFSAALLISCNTYPEQPGFSLTGNVKNIPDSTMVYLSKDNIKVDSTMVLNETFSFTGKVEAPYNAFLSLPTTRDYTFVWLENSEITFTAEKGKFREPFIKGSQVQKEYDLLNATILPFRQARDSADASLAERTLSATERDSVRLFFNDLHRKEKQATQDFIKGNPGSAVSTYILNFYKTTWGKEATEELYTVLPEARRESPDGKMITRFLELNKDPKVGEKYVDFEMNNAEGEPVRLSEKKGKYTLVHFWAAHCYYSVQESSNLVQNYTTFNDRGFQILGICIDADPKVFQESIQEHELPWTNLMSPAGKDNDAALIYGISGTPDNFLIDEQGIIIARNIRGDKLIQKLQELMPVTETAKQ